VSAEKLPILSRLGRLNVKASGLSGALEDRLNAAVDLPWRTDRRQ
jgi:hypothetical protein